MTENTTTPGKLAETATGQLTETAAPRITLWAGDYVKMTGNDHRFAGYWQVDRVNAKSISLSAPDGRRCKASVEFLLALTDAEKAEALDVFRKALAELVASPVLYPGATVTLKNKPGIYVVMKQTPNGYSCALLGGDNGRYWNSPAANVTAVKVTAEVQA